MFVLCVKHVMANLLSICFVLRLLFVLCSVLECSHVQIEIYGVHFKAKSSLRLANTFNPPTENAPQFLVSPPKFSKLLEQDGNYSPEHALVPAETG